MDAIETSEIERPGADEPEGIGAVRLFRSGKVIGHDEIVELVPDRRFAYAHTSNLPVRNYRGEIDLEPTDGGTAIRWVSTFEPKIPGTGALLRRGLTRFIAACTSGLADTRRRSPRSERTNGAPGSPTSVRFPSGGLSRMPIPPVSGGNAAHMSSRAGSHERRGGVHGCQRKPRYA